MPASKKHKLDHDVDEDRINEHDVITFLEWHAPGRPFVEHSSGYFVNIFLITMALQIILFLFAQYLLMLVVLSLVFLTFAMSIVPPHTFYYKITTEGIRVEDYFFIWEELYDFFFLQHNGKDVLYLTTKQFYPGELKIMLGDIPTDAIKAVLLQYLPYREYVKPTSLERAGHWLEKNFPLEKTAK